MNREDAIGRDGAKRRGADVDCRKTAKDDCCYLPVCNDSLPALRNAASLQLVGKYFTELDVTTQAMNCDSVHAVATINQKSVLCNLKASAKKGVDLARLSFLGQEIEPAKSVFTRMFPQGPIGPESLWQRLPRPEEDDSFRRQGGGYA
ncbi:MAG: hypothetical protein AB7E77_02180 [Desulfobulbus sp.]